MATYDFARDDAAIRGWASANGRTVANRGAIAKDVVIDYVLAMVALTAGAPVAERLAAKGAQIDAQRGAESTDAPVTIDVRSFVKRGSEWFVRTLPGDVAGDTVNVARKNRPATDVVLSADPVVRKFGAQSYAVAPFDAVKAVAAKVNETANVAPKAATVPTPAFSDAPVAPVTAAAPVTGSALPIGSLTVNGNTVYTVSNGTTVRVFATLAEAAAYAINPL